MENDGIERPLVIIEESSGIGQEHLVTESKDGMKRNEVQKDEILIESSDSNESIGPALNDNPNNCTHGKSDLEQNPKEAFNQFKVQPKEGTTVAAVQQRRPSAEEIAKNWKDLGVHRCPNCKFMTDKEELFKNHYTTCPAVRTTGMIKLTFKNGELSCSVCKDSWKNKSEFEEHLVCHMQDSPYVCVTCSYKKFSSRQEIEIHTKTEHPRGDAKCGLKGMKTARKYTEELIQAGTININGKLLIPKTPRNHTSQFFSSRESTSSQNTVNETTLTNVVTKSSHDSNSVKLSTALASPSQAVVSSLQSDVITIESGIDTVSTMASRPVRLYATNNEAETPLQLVSAAASDITVSGLKSTTASSSVSQSVTNSHRSGLFEIEPENNRPMPPARTSMNTQNMLQTSPIFSSKGTILKGISVVHDAKSKHLDSLFGQLDRSTSNVQPTNVSQKIKDIANPDQGAAKTEPVSKPIPYHLKTITEYTCTQPIKTVAPPISTMAPQNVIFVPVGGPVMPGGRPKSMPQTGLVYQTQQQGHVLLPLQQINPNAQVTNTHQADINRRQTTTVFSATQPHLQNASQIQTNPVILAAGTSQINNNFNNNRYTVDTRQQVSRSATIFNTGPMTTIMPSVKQQPIVQTSPSVLKETLSHPPNHFATKAPTVLITSGDSETGNEIPKKYLFKIKPGQGFVCEVCKKFTKDEYVFRRHVWEHFHGCPLACKTCSTEIIASKSILECKLVNNIVCNLIKRSAKEHQDEIAKPLKVLKVGRKEIIDITDDEEEKDDSTEQEHRTHAAEVIVLDDDDDENGGLKIQISATYSLSESKDLKQMVSKESQENTDVKSGKDTIRKTEETNIGLQNEGQLKNTGILPGIALDNVKASQNEIDNHDTNSKETNDALSGKVRLKRLFDKRKRDADGSRASEHSPDLTEQSKDSSLKQVYQNIIDEHDESEDEDGKFKENLLDKSLSEAGKDSDDVVSQVLETKLSVFDPSSKAGDPRPVEKNFAGMQNDKSSSFLQRNANMHTGVGKLQDRDLNVDSTLFDSEILSKESHNAFYICGYENCSFTCMSSGKYREHLQAKHGNEYNYVCGHCGQKDYTEDTHVRHIFTHANSKVFILYKCPNRLCKYRTNVLRLYAEHLRAHPTEELTVKCIYCHRTFPTIESLVQHLKQNLLKFVVCPYCSFKFVNRYVVMNHMKYFHPEKMKIVTVTSQIVCNEREINFYVFPKSKVFSTSNISTSEAGATTEILDIPALLDDFQRSTAQAKNAEQPVTDDKQIESGDNDDLLSLPEEDQSEFIKKGQTETKIDTANGKSNKAKGNSDLNTKAGPKSLECSQCSYLSYSLALHAKHLSLHETEPEREKRFLCNLCPNSTDNFPHFKKHVGNHIGKHVIKVLHCTTCAYSSNQKCHIMDHVRDAHSEEAMYTLREEVVESNHSECKSCSFKARTSEQVAAHERAVHRVEPVVSIKKSDGKTHQELHDETEIDDDAKTESEHGKSDNHGENVTRKRKLKYHCEYCSDFFKHKSKLKEHIFNDHKDIENKQFVFFKCKYCTFTSTMKDMIISHLEEDHPGMGLRILRKIEVIEQAHIDTPETIRKKTGGSVAKKEKNNEKEKDTFSEKEEVEIPDGNVFRQMFSCPKCAFVSNMRIKTMKHLKEHPELKPVRPDPKKAENKRTARKSSSSNVSKIATSVRKGSLLQPSQESTQPLRNPFIALKDSSLSKDAPIGGNMPGSNTSKESYILGEQMLHAALSACFIPLENDMKYQCRICKQKIFKKFVLHRHILDHLKIVFFKCRYCGEGSIERTLMTGHIQKDHPSRTVSCDSVDRSVLEQQFKERIFEQNFNDTVDIFAASRPEMNTADDHLKKSGIVKKAVHEFQTIDDSSDDDGTEEPVKEADDSEKVNSLKCPKCRYIARYKYNLSIHLDSHSDPAKVFTCSVCDYRGDKFSVIKHVYKVFHLTPAKVLENGRPLYENINSNKKKEPVASDKSRNDNEKNVSDSPDKQEERSRSLGREIDTENANGKQIKSDNVTVSKTGIYEIRNAFKCKICGEKRGSRTAMYHHLKTSKCKRPMLKCSLCSFRNASKAAIISHASKRHPGKKNSALNLPLTSKFRIFKFPVRQSKAMKKNCDEENKEGSTDSRTKKDFDMDGALSDKGQIRCQLCTHYVCESVMKMQFHVNTAHQGVVLYCQKCSYKSPLVKHMINHCKHLHLQRVALYGSRPAGTSKGAAADVKQEKESKAMVNTNDRIIFKCPKCSFELKSLKGIQVHLYVHFKYKPYCCKLCGKNFTRVQHIRNHTEKQHQGKAVKYDTNLDEEVESKVKKIYDSVKRNVFKQKKMLGKMRPSYLDQMELIEEGVRKREKMFYCDFCRYKSNRRTDVKKHFGNMHAGISKKRPLEIDSETESQDRKFSKREVFQDKREIRSPSTNDKKENEDLEENDLIPLKYKVVKSPNGKKRYKCTACDFTNDQLKSLKFHILRSHNSNVLKNNGTAFRCFYCSYSSIHGSSDVFKHFKHHHPSKDVKYRNRSGNIVYRENTAIRRALKEENTSPAKSVKSASPARSVTDSVSSERLEETKITNVTRYNCGLCEYSGEGFLHFRLHLLAHKEFTKITSEFDEESRMSCGFCTYLAKDNFELVSHIASHMGGMRYKCVYCDYVHYEKCKVTNHVKYCHTEREENVFDRELRQMCNGGIKLVNFSPVVVLGATKRKTLKKKYKRIMIETDDSSDSSSSENEDSENSSSCDVKRKGTSAGLKKVLLGEDGVSQPQARTEKSLKESLDMETNADKGDMPARLDSCSQVEDTGDYNGFKQQTDEGYPRFPGSVTETKNKGVYETQEFRIESQPFSPSDLELNNDKDREEYTQDFPLLEDENRENSTNKGLETDVAKEMSQENHSENADAENETVLAIKSISVNQTDDEEEIDVETVDRCGENETENVSNIQKEGSIDTENDNILSIQSETNFCSVKQSDLEKEIDTEIADKGGDNDTENSLTIHSVKEKPVTNQQTEPNNAIEYPFEGQSLTEVCGVTQHEKSETAEQGYESLTEADRAPSFNITDSDVENSNRKSENTILGMSQVNLNDRTENEKSENIKNVVDDNEENGDHLRNLNESEEGRSEIMEKTVEQGYETTTETDHAPSFNITDSDVENSKRKSENTILGMSQVNLKEGTENEKSETIKNEVDDNEENGDHLRNLNESEEGRTMEKTVEQGYESTTEINHEPSFNNTDSDVENSNRKSENTMLGMSQVNLKDGTENEKSRNIENVAEDSEDNEDHLNRKSENTMLGMSHVNLKDGTENEKSRNIENVVEDSEDNEDHLRNFNDSEERRSDIMEINFLETNTSMETDGVTKENDENAHTVFRTDDAANVCSKHSSGEGTLAGMKITNNESHLADNVEDIVNNRIDTSSFIVDSRIGNAESSKHCEDIITSSVESTDRDNACTSTNSVLEDGNNTNTECSRSPRNVFESMSVMEDSKHENSKPHDPPKAVITEFEDSVNRNEERNKVSDNLNSNVFEKFTSESVNHRASVSKDDIKYYKDNIFEMLTVDESNETKTTSNELVESDIASDEVYDKNIFETFGGISNENVEEDVLLQKTVDNGNKKKSEIGIESDYGNENSDESNIFSKFSAQNIEKDGQADLDQGSDQNKRDSDTVATITDGHNGEKENTPTIVTDNSCEGEKDIKGDSDEENDKNLFEKFSIENTDVNMAPSTNQPVDSFQVNTENNVEDMEVDELIQSIEKTVNESVVDMETN